MNELKRLCPECGLELPVGAGEMGCPGCSLRLALSPEAADAPEVGALQLPRDLKSRFFGDYELLEEIARGGMGVVYRARQLGINRLVALKMVQSHHLLSDEARLRFRVEIEAVAQLSHPHIVPLYESGEHDGAHYFTMRLLAGGDLAAYLKRARPMKERIQIVVQVCHAVHYAHQRGILHRDLKPSNILLDEQSSPHVADFGLAKSLDHDSGFTFTSSVLGSPNYMAPEQAAGGNRQLTTAVDVYGLGAILYHTLAGRPPFQAATPIETLRQVVDQDPAPPRSFNPPVDRDLETIALKCLRKDPGARYGTAEELAQDLERWLEGRSILARPVGPLALAWRWSRRHPIAAALAVALAIALVSIAVGSVVAAVRIRHAEERSTAHLRQSLLREVASLRLGGELGYRDRALGLLREAAALEGPPEFRNRLRDELLATLARTDLAFVAATFSNAPPRPEWLRLDDQFRSFAVVEGGTNILIGQVTNGIVRQTLASTNGTVTRLRGFSPSGRFLAALHTNHLEVWDLETTTCCLIRPGTNHTFAFAPSEDTLLLQESPYEAAVLELPSGRERLRWQSSAPLNPLIRRPEGWHILAFSRDGRTVAGTSDTSRGVELVDAETGQQVRVFTNSAAATAMGWSRHGSAFVVATIDGRIHNWSPRTGERRWWSPLMIAPARSVAYHPRGDWVAALCDDDHLRFFDGLEQGSAVEHPASGEEIRFSPDGSRLGPVRSENQWGWLELQPSDEYAEFRVGPASFNLGEVKFCHDGRMLAVGHADTVYLINRSQGTRLREREDWRMSACAFDARTNLLFVAGPNGLARYRYTLSEAGELRFTRRQVLHPGSGWTAFSFSAGGRFLAGFNSNLKEAFVFDHTFTNRVGRLGPLGRVGDVAVSPDGRWVTTGAHVERRVQIWDVVTGTVLQTLAVGLEPQGVFSNDGRWLALTGLREFHLLETGTWKPAPALPLRPGRVLLGAAAFSPDGRVLAVVVDRFTVQLFDLQRFESLGILRPPGLSHLRGLAFSPDGSQLAAVGPEARVSVWNLDRIRARLIEFGLSWTEPGRKVSQR